MTIDEILDRILLALLRTFDHVMYDVPNNLLLPDLGFIAATVGVFTFVFIIFVVIFVGIFGKPLAGR